MKNSNEKQFSRSQSNDLIYGALAVAIVRRFIEAKMKYKDLPECLSTIKKIDEEAIIRMNQSSGLVTGPEMKEELRRKYIEVQLAGYLSTFNEFSNRHPQDLLPLAKHCIEGLEKIIGKSIWAMEHDS